MKITLCGSIKFFDKMESLKIQLEAFKHEVFLPIQVSGVDYWSEDGSSRVQAKTELDLVRKHLDKIKKSDAILVVNITKGDITNYIGANTFVEMAFAQYENKKIFILNPLPDQKYINDELLSFGTICITNSLSLIQ